MSFHLVASRFIYKWIIIIAKAIVKRMQSPWAFEYCAEKALIHSVWWLNKSSLKSKIKLLFIESWLKLCFNTTALAQPLQALFMFHPGPVVFTPRRSQSRLPQHLASSWAHTFAVAIENLLRYRNLVFFGRQSFNCIKLSRNQCTMKTRTVVRANERDGEERFRAYFSLTEKYTIYRFQSGCQCEKFLARFSVSDPIIQFVNGILR